MADYTFPASDLDRPSQLAALLGTHWSAIYGSRQFVEDLAYSRAQLDQQSLQNLQEAIDATSRLTLPVYHTDLWYQLVLTESDMNAAGNAGLAYGDGAQYGVQDSGSPEYQYGRAADWDTYGFPVPDTLQDVSLLFNRIFSPSLTWHNGIDFTFDADRHVIRFRSNPFADARLPVRTVYENGVAADREVCVWVFRGKFDATHIYDHYGYPVGVYGESSANYKTLVNALWDGFVEGPHLQAVVDAVAAVADVPTVTSDSETVEAVLDDSRHQLVITDANVYRLSQNDTATVSAGDTVYQGQLLSNAAQIFELHRGEAGSSLKGLTLDKGFLVAGFLGGLTFVNREVDLEVDTSGDFTKISFEIGGWPGDVSAFWDAIHERGVAKGQTLAHLLDQRTNQVGEPTAAALPSTVNPLEFLTKYVLRNNAFVVQLKPQQFGSNSLPLVQLRHLRRLLPPHLALIVVVQLTADSDVVDLDNTTSGGPDYEETVTPYLGTVMGEEEVSPSTYAEEDTPIARYVDGVCL